ncbi:hypothetical protein DRF75_00690 [Ehrlichia minasensis]|uniref:Uncharacterized protein n=2 Tax=Ehrlichia minasensis TaxID=1242993 RepID=A0A4Q6I5N0_9RICK|nr:hypothetical protein DRF75_00690 [Ehrlichia minasensis]
MNLRLTKPNAQGVYSSFHYLYGVRFQNYSLVTSTSFEKDLLFLFGKNESGSILSLVLRISKN